MMTRTLGLCAALLLVATHARAAAPSAADDKSVQRARELFKTGAELAKNAQWADALGAFQESATLRRHAVTEYNIGVCERALGHYTRAREMLQQAVDDGAAKNGELPAPLAAEANGYLKEISTLVVALDTTVDPADAAVTVDGRPLAVSGESSPPTLVAGIAPSAGGQPLPATHVTIVLDPGAHVFVLSRKGFGDAVVNKTFRPGARDTLTLAAEKLPATFHISSPLAGAAVALDGVDIGVAPIDVIRPAGTYKLLVQHDGYVPYKSEINAEPGAALNLSADMSPEKRSIVKQWWFWTATTAVVSGAIVATYFLTRPAPERPAVDMGGLGWALKVP